MTTYAPRLTQQQIINAIWGWTDNEWVNNVWTPGLTFQADLLIQTIKRFSSTLERQHSGNTKLAHGLIYIPLPMRSRRDPEVTHLAQI